MKQLFVLLCVFAFVAYSQNSIEAAQGLVGRLLGVEYIEKFQFVEIPKEGDLDVFEITKSGENGSPIILKGSDGVSMGTALNNYFYYLYYLKYYCNSSVSWGENGTGNNIRLPAILPEVKETWHHSFAVQFRYYMNVCTVSYSAAFWDWSRWEKEIDWMALNGVNMPLTFTGQEYIWLKVFLSFGLTQDQILEYFSGPAFFAWLRMGNIQRWGGPLTMNWIRQAWEIQLKIVKRQTEYGMHQVYPAFAGFVPEDLQKLYPNATITKAENWGFDDHYSAVSMLDPEDALFKAIGAKFIQTMNEEIGYTSHLYNTDTFNEMDISLYTYNIIIIIVYIYIVYDGIKAGDPEGMWIMQGWQFHSPFWTDERLAAYLSGIPDDGVIILDLNSEQGPLFERFAKNNKKISYIYMLLFIYVFFK
ncbi:hypothetical protein WA158_004798 [Blastocystis sp. Blastoise]